MTTAEDTALRQDYVEMLGAEPAPQPLARLIPLEAPVETECEFWRRRAGELGKTAATWKSHYERLLLKLNDLLEQES